jgi:glycosyltransferase involved in cell wall biosynthesis
LILEQVNRNHLIGLDLKTYSNCSTGIGRYTTNLVKQLLIRKSFRYLGYPSPQTDLSSLEKLNLKLDAGISTRVHSTLLRSLIFLPLSVRKSDVRLIHSMDNSTVNYLFTPSCKRVATIHDLIVFKHPECFTRKHVMIVSEMIKLAAKKADHIITDSISTKEDLQYYFPKLNDSNISVIPLAVAMDFTKPDPDETQKYLEKENLPKKYFLYLGTFEPRKNIKRLIAAFKEFKQTSGFEDVGLVLAGGKGWLESKTGIDSNSFIEDKIFNLGFVDQIFLPSLYAGALAFVYPSLYEGFGLPILEAMQYGKAIITSNTSSLPEVAGNAALYIDPNSTTSIAEALYSMVKNNTLREKLSQNALQACKNFTWENTARKTETVYQTLLS